MCMRAPLIFVRKVLLEFFSAVALVLTRSYGKLKCFKRGGGDANK